MNKSTMIAIIIICCIAYLFLCIIAARIYSLALFPVGSVYKSRESEKIARSWLPYYYLELKPNNQADYKPKSLIIYLHGNAEDVHSNTERMQSLSNKTNSTVWLIEYPGYPSLNHLVPGVSNIKENLENYLTLIEEYREKHRCLVHIIGRSLGSGVACCLANSVSIDSVILVSPYRSLKTIFLIGYPFYWMDDFDNYRYLESSNAKITLIHGKNDSLISCNHSIALSQIKRHANPAIDLRLIEGGHNDMNPQEIESIILNAIN